MKYVFVTGASASAAESLSEEVAAGLGATFCSLEELARWGEDQGIPQTGGTAVVPIPLSLLRATGFLSGRRGLVIVLGDRSIDSVPDAVHVQAQVPLERETLDALLERIRHYVAAEDGRGEMGRERVKSLHLPLGERSYDIRLEVGGLSLLGQEVRRLFVKARRVAVVTNPTVGGLYFEAAERSLSEAGLSAVRLDIPDGEHAKCLEVVSQCLDSLIEAHFERREPLIALGGGVVGDVTAFVASIYLRGVPFVQVPTTLLAQVDSSVGGKTGVNSRRGKNLIGTFYQPRFVLIAPDVLRSLPEVEFRAGMAEVVKYGAIRDEAFLEYLEENSEAIRGMDPEALLQVIYRSCLNKAQVVVADEREDGERALLNFGHTLGHAFETLGAYGGLRHGEAVAMGMGFATALSESKGMCPGGSFERLERVLKRYGLTVRPPNWSAEDCVRIMRLDKKVEQGKVKMILLERLGKAIGQSLLPDDLISPLRQYLSGGRGQGG